MKRSEILSTANAAISSAREEEYGTPQKNLGNIAALWSGYLCMKFDSGPTPVLTAEDVAHMMVLLKIARTMSGNAGPDTYVDAAGYAALAGELSPLPSEKEKSNYVHNPLPYVEPTSAPEQGVPDVFTGTESEPSSPFNNHRIILKDARTVICIRCGEEWADAVPSNSTCPGGQDEN